MKRMTPLVIAAVVFLFGSVLLAAEPESPSPQQMMMQKMHAHMQMMQEQMTVINATENPEERKKLMQAHMQAMREGMMMLGDLEQAENPQMNDNAMAHHGQESPCTQDNGQNQRMQAIETRQHDMQQRMQMMRIMMQRMMDHQMVSEQDE